MSGGSGRARDATVLDIGRGREEPAYAGGLQCPGCMKMFKRESEIHRHWRLPIPCQMPGCTQTFRDDKLKSYISHHATKHSVDGQETFDQDQLEEYFAAKKTEHRNNIRPDLCTVRNPKFATTSQDVSGNWHLNPEGEIPLSPGFAQGDNLARYGQGETHPSHTGGSNLNGRVSELKQELSHKFQFVDYLKNTVLKAERDIQVLERKIKLLEEVIASSLPGLHSGAQPSLNHLQEWADLVDWHDEHEENSAFE